MLIRCTKFIDLEDIDIRVLNLIYNTSIIEAISKKYNVIDNKKVCRYKKILPYIDDMRKDFLKENFKALKNSFYYHPWIKESNMTVFFNKCAIEENINDNSHVWEYEDTLFSPNYEVYEEKDNKDYDKEEYPELYYSTWNLCVPFKCSPSEGFDKLIGAITFSYHDNKGKYIIINNNYFDSPSTNEDVDRFYKDIISNDIKLYSEDINDILMELKYTYNIFDKYKFWKVCEVDSSDNVKLF